MKLLKISSSRLVWIFALSWIVFSSIITIKVLTTSLSSSEYFSAYAASSCPARYGVPDLMQVLNNWGLCNTQGATSTPLPTPTSSPLTSTPSPINTGGTNAIISRPVLSYTTDKSGVAATTYTTPGFNLTAGKFTLLIVFGSSCDTCADAHIPTVTTPGVNWQFVVTRGVNTNPDINQKRTSIFRAVPSTNLNGTTVSVNFGSSTQQLFMAQVIQFDNVNATNNGQSGYVTSNVLTGSRSWANATEDVQCTFPYPFQSQNNATLGILSGGMDYRDDVITPEVGFTEISHSAAHSRTVVVNLRQGVADRSIGWSWGGPQAHWFCIGLELAHH